MGQSTRKTFHQELDELEAEVLRMAARVMEAVAQATHAVLDRDFALAQAVLDGDVVVDEACRRGEEQALSLLARQQPTAVDLRLVLTVLRLLHEIERIGDLAEHIARFGLRVPARELPPRIRGIIGRLAEGSGRLLALAIDAYADRDAGVAPRLVGLDDEVDDLHRQLLGELFGARLELEVTLELALLGRYYERIGDHAVTIAERVRYLVTGELS